MPGQPKKLKRIRVCTIDGRPRTTKELNLLRSNILGTHVYIYSLNDPNNAFILCTETDEQLKKVVDKLATAGLVIIEGDTTVPRIANPQAPQQRPGNRPGVGGAQGGGGAPNNNPVTHQIATGKPFGFVGLPASISTASPIWHDGSTSGNSLSGEIRLELTTLTPLLVGWERGQSQSDQSDWPVPNSFLDGGTRGDFKLPPSKSLLCPLRAPWGKRPVIIPGDTLKGLLRHEFGGLLGAPMERVAERHYSYRPNATFPSAPNPRLVPRIARIPSGGIELVEIEGGKKIRVPVKVELLPIDLAYDKNGQLRDNFYRFDDRQGVGRRYRGGQGAGEMLNSARRLHRSLRAQPEMPVSVEAVPESVRLGFIATVKHFVDEKIGHFSERHPQAKDIGVAARSRILDAAQNEVFQQDDLIWVEWDKQENRIVSLGWHYYYRWAYTDSVRQTGGGFKRHGLFPFGQELEADESGAPLGLSAVRRLFGFTGDNEGSQGIGRDDYSQLMGRVFVNAGLEVVSENETEEQRFLNPVFLKELGMPRPSAVEHYVKQPQHPNQQRPRDQATLVTYGDATGYDQGGELAGRKYFLDRQDAYTGKPWEDNSEQNKLNERSTLAIEASRAGRRFRFTIRFRDLERRELAAILVSLCPDQFKSVLGGNHPDGYCSKLGYARPLGWGSVQLSANALLILNESGESPSLSPEPNIHNWVQQNYQQTATQSEWLSIHRRKHPHAKDYPRAADRAGKLNIFTYHTNLRAEHSKKRRYSR